MNKQSYFLLFLRRAGGRLHWQRKRLPRKRNVFRVLAILLGLSPWILLELTLIAFGVGRPEQTTDPFIGFDSLRPLFKLSESGERYEISASRYLCFQPDSFSARKPANELRVFCLGGSTVQGRPYSIESSFTTWFELSLQAALPDRHCEVVNCGGISYASYRLVPILDEVLRYEPDLIVVYTGHNEFLEDRTYSHLKQRGSWVTSCLRWATRFRTYNVAWSQWNRWRSGSGIDGEAAKHAVQKPTLPTEVWGRLDSAGGLDSYHHDAAWHAGVAQHFEFNLRRMVSTCRSARVPIWFVNPVGNLRNCPPFKSEHYPGLDAVQEQAWSKLRERARQLYATRMSEAVGLLRQAQAIDDQHAGLAYDLAKGYEALQQFAEARECYERARDVDVCPLRMTSPLYAALERVCMETRTPLVDVKGRFEEASEHRIPGGYLLVDHVHPSISGHQMIAELLMGQFVSQFHATLADDWESRRDAAYRQQMASLDDAYYLEAQRRLEGLRKWAQGRADGVRPDTTKTNP